MRRRDIKVNNVGPFGSVGKASCLGLLVLGMVLVNPVAGAAYADEGATDEVTADSDLIVTDSISQADGAANPDEGIMTLADNASVVGISFSPASGSTNLTPTNSTGQSAQIKVLATVNVQKSGGYSVYVKSNSQNLVGQKNSSNVIPGLQGSATYANLPVNTWGYAAKEGTAIPDNATYKAISTSGNGDKIAENTNNKITSDTKTIALSFAAKINDAKPADTYKNTVTMSVVSSPMAVTAVDFGIEEMQEMTSTICSNAKDNDGDGAISGQLKDARDGKYYWVTKLVDGRCWMTQNLDLDLSTSKTLTPSDSDVSSNWTPRYNTAATADASTILEEDFGERSWSLGDYRIVNMTNTTSCGFGKNSLGDCLSQVTSYAIPVSADGDVLAHSLLGNYYQWGAALAGASDEVISSGQGSSSVCPKGWRLPTSGEGGQVANLLSAAKIGSSDVSKMVNAPYYFVRGGAVWQGSDYLAYVGNSGYYWSSTGSDDYGSGYFLIFDENSINPSDYGSYTGPGGLYARRLNGMSVRCVAR